MYSILAAEWPDVRRHLELRLARHSDARRRSPSRIDDKHPRGLPAFVRY